MAQQVTLKSNELMVAISTLGAAIQSITGKNGTEFLWYGDEMIWAGKAPILFPICGGLKEDKYIYEGKEYKLGKHGFARFLEYKTEAVSDARAVFLLKSDCETKKSCPFDFEFRAVFELLGNRLNEVAD